MPTTKRTFDTNERTVGNMEHTVDDGILVAEVSLFLDRKRCHLFDEKGRTELQAFRIALRT
ncbi:hypothetical protein EOS_27870 [Caballeronia mineralivorans PML1(12)]|uniref:Uncharacterized protein n=1 Tax=Caballeronia mineralivorans PML1(12) TaxID=908627 RepID=A0A0J1CQN2_9BURK|nr:hypothetical protein EOS_27870 [Caballeronia mineralivorans PML1(12)]